MVSYSVTVVTVPSPLGFSLSNVGRRLSSAFAVLSSPEIGERAQRCHVLLL